MIQKALRYLARNLPHYGKCEQSIRMLTLCVGDQATNAFMEHIEDAFAVMRMRAYVSHVITDEDADERDCDSIDADTTSEKGAGQ